jgi:hypothetical protein
MPIRATVGPSQGALITPHRSTIATACQGKCLPSHFGTSRLSIRSF